MSPHRPIAAILVLLTAFSLAARYRSPEPAYELALRENDRPGQFLFYAYPLADGRHGYTARMVHLHFPCQDQSESGVLTSAEWDRLRNFRRLPKLPDGDLARRVQPGEPWGSLEQNGKSLCLRYADLWALNRNNVISEAHSRLRLRTRGIF